MAAEAAPKSPCSAAGAEQRVCAQTDEGRSVVVGRRDEHRRFVWDVGPVLNATGYAVLRRVCVG